MVTVCVGGGRRTICNGLPLPTKCTMIKLFLFFSFGYFGIFQDFWCLSLDMSTKCTMIDFPFFFFLAVFVIFLEFWCLSLDIWHYFSLFHFKASLLWIYSFIFTLFRDCAGQSSTNQYPLFPPTRKPSYKVDFFSYLFSVSIFFYHSGQSTTHLFPPLSSYKIISSPCKKPFSWVFLWRVNHTNSQTKCLSSFFIM